MLTRLELCAPRVQVQVKSESVYAPVMRAPPMPRASPPPPHPEMLSPSYPYAGYAGVGGASLRAGPGAALPLGMQMQMQMGMGMGMGIPMPMPVTMPMSPAARAHDWQQLPSMVPPQVAAALSPSSPLAYRSPRPSVQSAVV